VLIAPVATKNNATRRRYWKKWRVFIGRCIFCMG
jgi:formate hydrogenlyase subunit 6/NADH:ubiquinone oxidoreductase subunit I